MNASRVPTISRPSIRDVCGRARARWLGNGAGAVMADITAEYARRHFVELALDPEHLLGIARAIEDSSYPAHEAVSHLY